VSTQNALPEALRDRFLRDVQALVPIRGDQHIGVAVSGGPDSLALLLLAHASLPGQVSAATVDHGLRPEAAEEAAFVASVCARLNVPHAILRAPDAPQAGNGVMAQARAARYALLEAWRGTHALDWWMTAHHADDQLETVVMRLNRGAGVGGLAGIRRRNGRVLRPLLGWRHQELVSVVEGAGLRAVDDPSNRDDRFDRARLRKAICGVDWIDPDAWTRSAAALEDADTALEWTCEMLMPARLRVEARRIVIVAPHELPAEIRRRMLSTAIQRINADAALDGPKVTRLLQTLGTRGKGTLDGVLCDGRDTDWAVSLAPPRRTVR